MPTFASFHLPAIAGLPVITVPLGFFPEGTEVVWDARGEMVDVAPGVPFGIAFLGRRWSEEVLVGAAYAFERRTQVRRGGKPIIEPKTELRHQLALRERARMDREKEKGLGEEEGSRRGSGGGLESAADVEVGVVDMGGNFSLLLGGVEGVTV